MQVYKCEKKNITKNTQKTSVKTSIKLQKTLIEKKHENYSTFMYKCIIKYRFIKYEKNLKNKQTKHR